MALGCDWDDVLCQELQSTQELSDEIEDCDHERTPSTLGEDELVEQEGTRNKPAVWWAVVLKQAGLHLGLEDNHVSTSQAPKVTVVSGCSGCSPEAWVLKSRRAERDRGAV